MTEDIFNAVSASVRQDACRRYVESAEAWLRRLAHSSFVDAFGQHYITNGPWKSSIKSAVSREAGMAPGKFKREIEATTFDQLIDIICHPQSWELIKSALEKVYPHGVEEARTFLKRIKDIRNDVSHGRQCSIRQLEQAVCYSNDIADSIKDYFQSKNMSKEYNAPTFVKFSDSLNNAGEIPQTEEVYRAIPLSMPNHRRLYPGDILVVEVEVDPSFDEGSYEVQWLLKTMPRSSSGSGKVARIPIANAHIGYRLEVQFALRTNNTWHRSSDGKDDIVDFYYKVLPLE